MAMYTAHIAIMLEVFGVAAGLVALYFANRHKAKLIKIAGILLVIVGTSGLICTVYYSVKYFIHGHFEHAYDSEVRIDGLEVHSNSGIEE